VSGVFAPAQLVGYVALVLGVVAFSQKRDQRLRFFSGSQAFAYAVHFLLLGNAAAACSAAVSSARSFLSMRYRAPWLVAAFGVVILVLGANFASGVGWLPIISSVASTIAVFLCRGILMRLVLLGCTMLWLVNNVVSGSIGGTILEIFIATINTSTIVRLARDRAKAAAISGR
jgi:hypothetical protein